MPIQRIEPHRAALTATQLWEDDQSPYLEGIESIISQLDDFVVYRFKLIRHDTLVDFFPDVDRLHIGEKFGFIDILSYGDDPGLDTTADRFKMIRGTLVIEAAYESQQKAQIGKAYWMLHIDDSLPRFKFFVPNGQGIFHECLVLGDVSTDLYVPQNADPTMWVVVASCNFGIRLVVDKDRHRLHGDPVIHGASDHPYNNGKWPSTDW